MQCQDSSQVLNNEEVYNSQRSLVTDLYIDIDFNSVQNINSNLKNDNCNKGTKKYVEPIIIEDESHESVTSNKIENTHNTILSENDKKSKKKMNLLKKKKKRECIENNHLEKEKEGNNWNTEEELEYRKRSDFLKAYHPNKGSLLHKIDPIQKESISSSKPFSENKQLLNFKESKILSINKKLIPEENQQIPTKDEIMSSIKSIEKKYDLLKKELKEQNNNNNKLASSEYPPSLQNLLIKLLGAAMKLTIQIDENINTKLEAKCNRCEKDSRNDIINGHNKYLAKDKNSEMQQQYFPNYDFFTNSPSHLEPVQFQSPHQRQVNPMDSIQLQNVLQFLQYTNSAPSMNSNMDFINPVPQANLLASPTNGTFFPTKSKSKSLTQSESNQQINQNSSSLKKIYYCYNCGLPNHKASQCNKKN